MKRIIVCVCCLILSIGVFFVQGANAMQITSPHFVQDSFIPKEFTCDGTDISPELHIHDMPGGTRSLVLIVDDPDAPVGTWVHWVVYDIDPVQIIGDGEVTGTQGANDFGRLNYGGPCPPSGTHRYFFKVYALDTRLNLEEGLTKEHVVKAIQGHVLAQAQLMGVYSRGR